MKKLMYSSAGLLIIGLAFLAFNIVSGLTLTNARLDLTEQKLYTISTGTKAILGDIKDPIDLYFFYSEKNAKDLAVLRNYAKRVTEMLKLYEHTSNGKIKLHIIDPAPFSADEDKAAEFGLNPVPLDQTGEKLYFGLAGTNHSKAEQIIPLFQPDHEQFLEYELSRLIQSLSRPERPTIGVMSTLKLDGGLDVMTRQDEPQWMVMNDIRQQFQVKTLQPDVDAIPAELSTLLLVHPKKLPQKTLYAIDQFVMRGGKLMVFVDPYSEIDHPVPMQGDPESVSKASSLDPLLQAWGVRMVPDQVVGDGYYGMSVGMGDDQPSVRYVGALSLPKATLDQNDISTSGLESMTVSTAGMLEPLASATTQFTPLIRTSQYAMPIPAQRFFKLRNPEALLEGFQPTGQRYVLAGRITGPAKSAFPQGIEGHTDGVQENKDIQVVVVADTDILSDRMWVAVQEVFGQRVPQPWADNGNFVVNALDNLAGSDALISVRSRGHFNRPFERVEALQREAEVQFRKKERTLRTRLAETEKQLAALQKEHDPGKANDTNPEQRATLQRFTQEKLKLRKELRDVNYQLNASIESLGQRLKLINIALIPLLLTLGALALGMWRRRKA